MMVAHNDDFCRGVAMVLRGESTKAGTYVTHSTSLGTLREKMVRRFVADETPQRFSVETGLIRDHEHDVTSRQCDLLIHDQWTTAPLYRYDDFVIAHSANARAVVEVKSALDKKGIGEFLDIHASVMALEVMRMGLSIPTFGYGLTGATIDTIADHLREGLTADRLTGEGVKGHPPHLNWPVCLAVQDRNIIGIRPVEATAGDKNNWPVCFCLADLTKPSLANAPSADGIETGLFLFWYDLFIKRRTDCLTTEEIYKWFNALPLLPEGKVWLTPDGQVHQGNMTFVY